MDIRNKIKRIISSLFLTAVICVCLAGCKSDKADAKAGNDTIAVYDRADTESIEALLKSYDNITDEDEAVDAGMYVLSGDTIVGGKDIWDDFVEKTAGGQEAAVIMAISSESGLSLKAYIVYEDGTYSGYFDDAMMGFYETAQYKYLNIYNENGAESAAFVNDISMSVKDAFGTDAVKEEKSCPLYMDVR